MNGKCGAGFSASVEQLYSNEEPIHEELDAPSLEFTLSNDLVGTLEI